MIRSWAAVALLLCAAGAASAQAMPSIALEPGEAATVHIGDDGAVGEPERHAAEWSRFDLFAARQLAGMTPPQAPMPEAMPVGDGPGGIRPDPVPPNEVRIRFLSIADRHALLVVENGLERALAYRARMTVEGEARPTDVCVVLPGLPSYEHWPHPIERIELSGFRFVDWPAGRAPACE